jgi:hypothetical protein
MLTDPKLFKKLDGEIWDPAAATKLIQNKIHWEWIPPIRILGQGRQTRNFGSSISRSYKENEQIR